MRLDELRFFTDQCLEESTPIKARTFLGHEVEVTGAELKDGVIYIDLGLLEGV